MRWFGRQRHLQLSLRTWLESLGRCKLTSDLHTYTWCAYTSALMKHINVIFKSIWRCKSNGTSCVLGSDLTLVFVWNDLTPYLGKCTVENFLAFFPSYSSCCSQPNFAFLFLSSQIYVLPGPFFSWATFKVLQRLPRSACSACCDACSIEREHGKRQLRCF